MAGGACSRCCPSLQAGDREARTGQQIQRRRGRGSTDAEDRRSNRQRLESASGQHLSGGSAGSFWLAGDVRGLRHAGFKRTDPAAARLAPDWTRTDCRSRTDVLVRSGDALIRRKQMTNVWGATSTTDEVLSGIDLHGKRVLVTG